MNHYKKLDSKTIIDLTTVTIYKKAESNIRHKDLVRIISSNDTIEIAKLSGGDILWIELEKLCKESNVLERISFTLDGIFSFISRNEPGWN